MSLSYLETYTQLLAGADDALLSKLHLNRDAMAYTYLSQGGCATVPGMDDRVHFKEATKVPIN